MKVKRFNKIVEDTLHECKSVLVKKEVEYATEVDRFDNFKRAAEIKGTTPIEAAAGMMVKHEESMWKMINNPDMVTEKLLKDKLGDLINYILLIKGLMVEHMEKAQVNPVNVFPKSSFKNIPEVGVHGK